MTPAAVRMTLMKLLTNCASRIEFDVFRILRYCKMSGTLIRRKARMNRRPVNVADDQLDGQRSSDRPAVPIPGFSSCTSLNPAINALSASASANTCCNPSIFQFLRHAKLSIAKDQVTQHSSCHHPVCIEGSILQTSHYSSL